jgi:Amidohydrolase family/Complex I intermediate-associated protein 30 (CIA30)
MWQRTTLLTLGLAGSLIPAMQAAAPLMFRHVRVFDGHKLIANTSVLVEDGRIEALGPQAPAPADAQVIDGAGKTLLPGLIDAHAQVWTRDMLKQQLMFGVTTVLDMFTSVSFAADMRQEQREGQAGDRADMYSAGTLITTPGGHGTEYGLKIPTLSSPADAQAFVDARIAEGSDYIKLVLDDATAYGGHRPTLSKETLAAAIAAAHKRGKLTVVHIATLQDAQEALEAGADGLAHLFVGPESPPDFGRFVAAHHAFVVATLTVLESVCGLPSGEPLIHDAQLAPYLSPSDILNLKRSFSLPHRPSCAGAFEAVKQLQAAGVPILVGDDVPNPGTAPGATEHRELALLVEAGLTPIQALTGATSAAARVFHLEDRGVIAPGKRADLLLVNGDPTTDILATRDIAGVWKGGVAADRQAYRAAIEKEKEQSKAAAAAPPPAGSESGLVSDFEQARPESRFGAGWMVSTDAIMGGKSTAQMRIAPGGAQGSQGCLEITGDVVSGSGPAAWAGALFSPGKAMMQPANLSSKKSLSFWAKGEGRSYTVMLFAKTFGFQPAVETFTAGPEWKHFAFPLKDFNGTDGHDLIGVFFGSSPGPGKFELWIDDVRFE